MVRTGDKPHLNDRCALAQCAKQRAYRMWSRRRMQADWEEYRRSSCSADLWRCWTSILQEWLVNHSWRMHQNHESRCWMLEISRRCPCVNRIFFISVGYYIPIRLPNQELSVLYGGPTLHYGEQLSLYFPHMLRVNMARDLAHLQLSDLQGEIRPSCRTSDLQGERIHILRT